MIARRMKDALAAAKARGTKLGGWRGGTVVDAKLGIAAVKEAADAFAARVGPTIAMWMGSWCRLRMGLACRLTACLG